MKTLGQICVEINTLWSSGDPCLLDVLRCVAQTKLFEIPESVYPIAARTNAEQKQTEEAPHETQIDEQSVDLALTAWDEALKTPFSQIAPYADYVAGTGAFGTHQGVKGLEFPRVLVVMDDSDARGFMFSYEKLFAAKETTRTEVEGGKESAIDRTRRLFYVTCSRAEESLAIVAYTSNPDRVRDTALTHGWFERDEIEMLPSTS